MTTEIKNAGGGWLGSDNKGGERIKFSLDREALEGALRAAAQGDPKWADKITLLVYPNKFKKGDKHPDFNASVFVPVGEGSQDSTPANGNDAATSFMNFNKVEPENASGADPDDDIPF